MEKEIDGLVADQKDSKDVEWALESYEGRVLCKKGIDGEGYIIWGLGGIFHNESVVTRMPIRVRLIDNRIRVTFVRARLGIGKIDFRECVTYLHENGFEVLPGHSDGKFRFETREVKNLVHIFSIMDHFKLVKVQGQ